MSKKAFPMEGKLEKFSVPRILQAVLDENRAGCLEVTRDGVERKLYMQGGMITYASSTEPQDRMSEIFISQGKLTREEVEEALSQSREQGTLLGRVLLVEGRITSFDLFQGVTTQIISIVERMRSWRKGNYIFNEEGEPPSGAVLLRIPLSLYLGAAEKKKAGLRREEEVKAADLPGTSGDDDDDDFEEEIIVEESPRGEVTAPVVDGEPQAEEGAPGSEDNSPSVEGVAAAASVSGEAADSAGQAWGEVVFSEDKTAGDKTAGDNGDQEAAETIFHLQELRRRRGADARTLLGVKGDATKEEIGEAYNYLASVLHPDSHPPDLTDEMTDEISEIFKEVAAAYEELTAAGKPSKAPPGGAPFPQGAGRMSGSMESLDPGDETRRFFYKAKEYIAGGNYWQAVDALRHVVRRKPKDASCRNLLGFCLMQTGRRLHEAEEHIKEAMRLDPGNPDYLTNLGLVYKAGRSFKKARAIFQQALLYDKNHAMARQELRNLPSEVEWGRESGGFWKKLFGK